MTVARDPGLEGCWAGASVALLWSWRRLQTSEAGVGGRAEVRVAPVAWAGECAAELWRWMWRGQRSCGVGGKVWVALHGGVTGAVNPGPLGRGL